MDYVKLTTKNCIHNGYQYKEGLNCLNGEFNHKKILGSGGLYFCPKEYFYLWIIYDDKFMYYIWDVELCEDSKIVDMGDTLKTDKFILKNKRTIWDNEEICKSILKKVGYGYTLQYVKPEVMNEEICKLAVQNNGLCLQYVKPELMNDEICKLAVKQNGNALRYVKPELMTDEICKLAIQQNGYALYYVRQKQTSEFFKLLKIISFYYVLPVLLIQILTFILYN